MHFAFWLPYESLHVAVLAPEAPISSEILPRDIKWIVLLDRYQVNAPMRLIRSEGLLQIYTLPRAEENGSF
jgi:hypothetical protein